MQQAGKNTVQPLPSTTHHTRNYTPNHSPPKCADCIRELEKQPIRSFITYIC